VSEHDHHHDHPPHLAHHWDNVHQQFDAGKLGMWLFLATEVLLFGGLFCGYAVWRGNHPELFQFGSQFLDRTMGAINTVVLILSSLTMAWGVTAAQRNQQALLRILLILTLAGAVTFLVIKYFEYTHKFHEGFYPGVKFYEKPEHSHMWKDSVLVPAGDELDSSDIVENMHQADADTADTAADSADAPASPAPSATAPQNATRTDGLPAHEPSTVETAATPPGGILGEAVDTGVAPERAEEPAHPLQDPERPHNAHVFFNIYFMMTGLHGVHVLVGMIVIVWLLIRSFKGHFSAEYFTPVDLGGLYWHIVDLIWIFLFPLFYLI
jgi:cytochrome c oxidase subunit 3